MYPYKVFFGLTLYDILVSVGIIVAFAVFGFLADRRKIKVKHQKFSIICGCAAIAAGLGSAVVFQAIYNIPKRGKFIIDGKTGITFYGGLIGGVAMFLLIYFVVGKLFYKKTDTPRYHNENFFSMASAAITAVPIAHSLGRIGCLTAGCCHGSVTDAWYGIDMYVRGEWNKYVPTQLFEAIFLLILFAFLFINAYSRGKYNLPIYMFAYGVWRYVIEFVRADYRGSIGIDAVTPSQLIAIIMIVGAVGVFFLERSYTAKVERRYAEMADKSGGDSEISAEAQENAADIGESIAESDEKN